MSKWRATAYYRTESGEPLDVTWDLDTLDLVPELFGRGHHHGCIDSILIERGGETSCHTVEAEVKL